MKNVNVVADKSLRKQAITLVHSISKLDDVKAAYWTPKQLLDNEVKLTGKQAVIFIGSNPESDPYIDLIKAKTSKHGVSWGFDGPKAAISIESNEVDSKALAKDLKKLVDIAKEAEKANLDKGLKVGDAAAAVGTSIGVLSSAALLPTLGIPFLSLPLLIFWIIKNIRKRGELRNKQYAYGLLVFSQNTLDDFLNQLV